MYTGTLINDLLVAAARILRAKTHGNEAADLYGSENEIARAGWSESEKFAQALGLSTADRDLSLLLVVHPKLVRTFEPGNDLANAVDVDQVGAVSAPE